MMKIRSYAEASRTAFPCGLVLLACLAFAAPAWTQQQPKQQRVLTLLPDFSVSNPEGKATGEALVIGGEASGEKSGSIGKPRVYLYFSSNKLGDLQGITRAQLRLVLCKAPEKGRLTVHIKSVTPSATPGAPPAWDEVVNLDPPILDSPDKRGGKARTEGEADLATVFDGNAGGSFDTKSGKMAFLLSPEQRVERDYCSLKANDTTDTSSNQPRLIISYNVAGAARTLSDGWPAARSEKHTFAFAAAKPVSFTQPELFIRGANTTEGDDLAGNLNRSPNALNPCPNDTDTCLKGPEGNIYILDGAGNISAQNPQQRTLWKSEAGTREKVRMTLGPDGRFIYVIRPAPSPKLLAINTATGESKDVSLDGAVTDFHNPVVAKHPQGADYIFVSGNKLSSQPYLLRVLNSVGKDDPTDTPNLKIQDKDKVGIAGEQISQPILYQAGKCANDPCSDLSNTYLFFVLREGNEPVAHRMNAQNPELDGGVKLPGAATFNDNFWHNENPVVDKDNHVVFYTNGALFFPDAAEEKDRRVQVADAPDNVELAFGESGRLYIRSLPRYGARTAVLPVIPSYDVGKADAPNEIESPVDLRATGTVPANKTLTLSAPLSISLANGFTVKQGATLTIRIGQP